MQKFGQMCITTYKDNTQQAKLPNQATPDFWVTYAEGRPTGTYWVFNPKKKTIILTRDMTFLQRSYGEYSKVEKPVLVTMSCEESDDEEELEMVQVVNNYNVILYLMIPPMKTFLLKISTMKTKQPPVVQAVKKLKALFNNNDNKIVAQALQEKMPSKLKLPNYLAMLTNYTKPAPEEPHILNKAWNHLNEDSQKWQEGITKNLWIWPSNTYDTWLVKVLHHPNCRCIKNKWVFIIKNNGLYSVHLVAWSSVVKDTTFCILLPMILHFGYLTKIVNIETIFLYGDLEEEIYMECPHGMSNNKKDDCIILNKWVYGLFQAAMQYYKNAIKILKNLGFVGGNIDPCLYVTKMQMV